MGWFMTQHTFLSLGWDEWASIATILTSLALIGRWLIKKAKKDLLEETNHELRRINCNLEIKNRHDEKVDARLEKGDRKLDDHEIRIQDHERRIKRLEEDR